MKDKKIIVSSLFIFISFFIGYNISEREKDNINKIEKNYVNIEVLKTKIKVSKDKNTIVKINGNILKNEVYDLR